MGDWNNFFLGELGAAAALAGLLFVAVSVNQARILELGRMADRGLEALVMLFVTLVVASLALVPGQAMLALGTEVFLVGAAALALIVPLEEGYLRLVAIPYRRNSSLTVWINRIAIGLVAVAGVVFASLGSDGAYLLAFAILMTFGAAGMNAWVLLIEINR